jgi:hypothetical protein
MRYLLLFALILFPAFAFAENLPDLRGQAFNKAAACNVINAREILQLSTTPFTEREVPDIRDLLLDTKTARTECFEEAESIIDDLLIDERNLADQVGAPFLLKLQYEADRSFQNMLTLRKQVSRSLLDSMLRDIENHFDRPVEMAQFYAESEQTQYLIKLETALSLESERRQIFVEEQAFQPTEEEQVVNYLQKAHYQLAKTLLLFEDWAEGGDRQTFFKHFNNELRYGVAILSKILPLKNAFNEEEYKTFRDMLQNIVRLNLKMADEENWSEMKSGEIYAEISTFTETIRLLLQ